MSVPLLSVCGLEKSFGAVVAAARIDARVAENEIVGIIGANGAGKTSFVNMITGYLKPSAGAVYFRGREITGASARDIARVGIRRSFQVPQLFFEMSVRENLIAAIALFGSANIGFWRPAAGESVYNQAEDLMLRFEIDAHRDRPAAALPQGVRKFLDIAMAVVGAPALVLLDEPTSGVSAEEKFEMMDRLIAALRAIGAAVVFVEHDMDIVARYAQRVWAFYEGRIIGDGETGAVLADAQVRRLVIGGG
jgi:branched-chain amino acid transport system ATP-binding protein